MRYSFSKYSQYKLKKKALVQSDQDVKKRLEKISSQFKDYQLALYLFSFSSFMEVKTVLLGAGPFHSMRIRFFTSTPC